MEISKVHKYSTRVPLIETSREDFLVIAYETVKQLGWEVGMVGENGLVVFTSFPMGIWAEEIRIQFEPHAVLFTCRFLGTHIKDIGKNRETLMFLIHHILEQKKTLTPEDIAQKREALQPLLAPPEKDILARPEPQQGQIVWRAIAAFFIPRKDYWVTPILVYINVAVYLLMVFSGVDILDPSAADLSAWGGNSRRMADANQWWRLFNYFFVHSGLVHLCVNMSALMAIGMMCEPYLGRLRFTVAYILTGLVAGLSSLWWHYFEVSVGASGAVFGLYGVFLAMLVTGHIEKTARRVMLLYILIFIAINFTYLEEGVDNAAHIGGLVAGIVIGLAYAPSLAPGESVQSARKVVVILLLTILPASAIFYGSVSYDIPQWEEAMDHYDSMESLAMEVYPDKKSEDENEFPWLTDPDSLVYYLKLASEMGDTEIDTNDMDPELQEIRDALKEDSLAVYGQPWEERKKTQMDDLQNRGIYYWAENIALIQGMDKLDLPKKIRLLNEDLKKYSELRLKTYQWMYEDIRDDAQNNAEKIEEYEEEINLLKIKIGEERTAIKDRQ